MSSQGQSTFRVTAALLTVVGALAYANWRLWSFAPESGPIAPPPIGNASRPETGGSLDSDLAPMQRSAAEFPQSTRRPLFFASRRPVDVSQPKVPAASKPANQAAPPATLEQVQLVGIMRTGKAKARALIRTGSDSPGVWFGIGDAVRGWQLKEIGDDKAVFEANGQRVQVRLFATTASATK